MSGIAGVFLLEAERSLAPPTSTHGRGLGGEGEGHRVYSTAAARASWSVASRGQLGHRPRSAARRPARSRSTACSRWGPPRRGGRRRGVRGRAARALLERGVSAVNDLRGEFVLAFWDGRDRRAPPGDGSLPRAVPPVAQPKGALLFASRMRPAAAPVPFHPTGGRGQRHGRRRRVDHLHPRTIFKEVAKVEPGHVLTLRDGRLGSRRTGTWTSRASTARRSSACARTRAALTAHSERRRRRPVRSGTGIANERSGIQWSEYAAAEEQLR